MEKHIRVVYNLIIGNYNPDISNPVQQITPELMNTLLPIIYETITANENPHIFIIRHGYALHNFQKTMGGFHKLMQKNPPNNGEKFNIAKLHAFKNLKRNSEIFGVRDPALTNAGMQQALYLNKFLLDGKNTTEEQKDIEERRNTDNSGIDTYKDEIRGMPIMFTSYLQRTIQTASLVSQGMYKTLISMPYVREMSPGPENTPDFRNKDGLIKFVNMNGNNFNATMYSEQLMKQKFRNHTYRLTDRIGSNATMDKTATMNYTNMFKNNFLRAIIIALCTEIYVNICSKGCDYLSSYDIMKQKLSKNNTNNNFYQKTRSKHRNNNNNDAEYVGGYTDFNILEKRIYSTIHSILLYIVDEMKNVYPSLSGVIKGEIDLIYTSIYERKYDNFIGQDHDFYISISDEIMNNYKEMGFEHQSNSVSTSVSTSANVINNIQNYVLTIMIPFILNSLNPISPKITNIIRFMLTGNYCIVSHSHYIKHLLNIRGVIPNSGLFMFKYNITNQYKINIGDHEQLFPTPGSVLFPYNYYNSNISSLISVNENALKRLSEEQCNNSIVLKK